MSYKEIERRINAEQAYQKEVQKLIDLGHSEMQYCIEASDRRVKYLMGKL